MTASDTPEPIEGVASRCSNRSYVGHDPDCQCTGCDRHRFELAVRIDERDRSRAALTAARARIEQLERALDSAADELERWAHEMPTNVDVKRVNRTAQKARAALAQPPAVAPESGPDAYPCGHVRFTLAEECAACSGKLTGVAPESGPPTKTLEETLRRLSPEETAKLRPTQDHVVDAALERGRREYERATSKRGAVAENGPARDCEHKFREPGGRDRDASGASQSHSVPQPSAVSPPGNAGSSGPARDESKPPPGFVRAAGAAKGDPDGWHRHYVMTMGPDEQSLAEAWAIYDREHTSSAEPGGEQEAHGESRVADGVKLAGSTEAMPSLFNPVSPPGNAVLVEQNGALIPAEQASVTATTRIVIGSPPASEGEPTPETEDSSAPYECEGEGDEPPGLTVRKCGEYYEVSFSGEFCFDTEDEARGARQEYVDAILAPERRLREAAERERDEYEHQLDDIADALGCEHVHEVVEIAGHAARRIAAAERRAKELGSIIDEACRTLAGHGWVCGGASLVEAVENACMAGKVAARRAEEAEQCRRLEREARETAERELERAECERVAAIASEVAAIRQRILEVGGLENEVEETRRALDDACAEINRLSDQLCEAIPCQSCGADPRVSPPSGAELPIVKGALDAQERVERECADKLAAAEHERDQARGVAKSYADIANDYEKRLAAAERRAEEAEACRRLEREARESAELDRDRFRTLLASHANGKADS